MMICLFDPMHVVTLRFHSEVVHSHFVMLPVLVSTPHYSQTSYGSTHSSLAVASVRLLLCSMPLASPPRLHAIYVTP